MRVNVQLIDAIKGHHLWAERYDRTLEDVFEVQDEITNEIVTALDVKLGIGEQARHYRSKLKNPELRELFYQGRNLFNSGIRENNAEAFKVFSQLIERDPESYLGYVWCAWSLWWRLFRGWGGSPAELLQSVKDYAEKALSLNKSSAGAIVILGGVHLFQGEYPESIEMADQALALSPNGADVLTLGSFIYVMAGQTEKAINACRSALRLSPVAQPMTYNLLGVSLREAGRYEEAIDSLKMAVSQAPGFITARYALVTVLLYAKRDVEAKQEAHQLLSFDPEFDFIQYTERLPFRDREVNEKIRVGLSRAGIIPAG